MSDLQAPIINFQVKAGKSKAGFTGQRVLIIGHGNGTNASGSLIKDIQPNEVSELCGEKSLCRMAYVRFRNFNKVTPIDFITLKSNNGDGADEKLTVSGAAKESKVIRISVLDDEYTVRVSIARGNTAAQIKAKIAAGINTLSDRTVMTASVDSSGAIITLAGIAAGSDSIGKVKVLDRLLGVVFTSSIGDPSSGHIDTSGIFAQLTDRYQTIVFDSMTDLAGVDRYLTEQFNTSNAVNGGVGVVMRSGSISSLKTTYAPMNSKVITVLGNPSEMAVNAIPLLAATEFAAKRSLRLTDGAVLGDIVVEAQEAFGGINKSSLPYHNTPMSYFAPVDLIDIAQVEELNKSGITLMVPQDTGTVLGSVVTLYKKDGSGVEDKTFKYLNAVDTSLAVQEYLFNNCQKEFGQTRATGGSLVEGVAMTNALSVKAYVVGLYDSLVKMALTQGGADARKSFKRNLTVTLDPTSGVYKIFAPTAIVSQLRGIDGIIAISYTF